MLISDQSTAILSSLVFSGPIIPDSRSKGRKYKASRPHSISWEGLTPLESSFAVKTDIYSDIRDFGGLMATVCFQLLRLVCLLATYP